MMPSRGMGIISPSKQPRLIKRRDANVPVKVYAGGGKVKPFWDKEKPKGHKTKHLSDKQMNTAKARAKAAGRPYPNLVDNAAVARKCGGGKIR